ncbi:MAG: hypothetical protein AB9882_14840 [Ignavibacteriaceae bacterium]
MNGNIREINDLIPSLAIGTLTREEYIRATDKLGELSSEEISTLAEYQHLTALLSVIIDVKEPSQDVKVDIVKKLSIFQRPIAPKEEKQEVTVEEIIPEEITPTTEEELLETNEMIPEVTPSQEPELINEPVSEETPDSTQELSEQIDTEMEVEKGEIVEEEIKQEEADEKLKATVEELLTEEDELLKESQKYYQKQLELFAAEDKSQFIVEYKDPEDLDSLPLTIKEEKETDPAEQKKQSKKKSYGIRTIDYVISGAVAAVLILVIVGFFSLNADIAGLSRKINELPDRNLAKYEQVIVSVREYLYNRKILDNVLMSDRMVFIELAGGQNNSTNSGKFFLDIQNRVGFLVLTGIPELSSDKILRLWISTPTAVSGIDLKRSDGSNSIYEAINLPALNVNESISVVISEEVLGSNNSTNSPNVYYSGSIFMSAR